MEKARLMAKEIDENIAEGMKFYDAVVAVERKYKLNEVERITAVRCWERDDF